MEMTKSEKVFNIINIFLLFFTVLLCLLPIINLLAVSLSKSSAVEAGRVIFWPINFTTMAYSYVINKAPFWRAFLISIERVGLGVIINLFFIITMAYPLSKSNTKFRSRTAYVWFIFLTMLFNGGMIPTYFLISKIGMMDSMWALTIPGAVQAFSIVLMLNFFRQVPIEMEEAAIMDGAKHWWILWRVYVPVSLPAIATLTLFSVVGHWNAWFDGMLYMNRPENYPLQTYLRTVVISLEFEKMSTTDLKYIELLSNRTIRASQIFVSMIPVLMLYPFLQKYFVKGMVLGSVKG